MSRVINSRMFSSLSAALQYSIEFPTDKKGGLHSRRIPTDIVSNGGYRAKCNSRVMLYIKSVETRGSPLSLELLAIS